MIGHTFVRSWLDMPKQFLNKKDDGRNAERDEDSSYFRDNDFFRFFCCYLAFNHMFDGFHAKTMSMATNRREQPFLDSTRRRLGYETWSDESKKVWKPYERERIMQFADYVIKKARKEPIDGFMDKLLESRFFLETDVKQRNLSPKPPKSNLQSEESKWLPEDDLVLDLKDELQDSRDIGYRDRLTVILVLLRIYQVRCNLFHGDKDASDPDDQIKVKEGADFLERFILLCIDDLEGKIQY